jgi:hypothetical protein
MIQQKKKPTQIQNKKEIKRNPYLMKLSDVELDVLEILAKKAIKTTNA